MLNARILSGCLFWASLSSYGVPLIVPFAVVTVNGG